MAKQPPLKKINAQDQRFVDEYLVDSKTERAALAAGFAPSTAKTKAYLWVSNRKYKPQVFDRIKEGQEKLSAATMTEAERVRLELARVAFHRMSQVLRVDDYGHPVLDYSACTPEDLDNLSEVSNETVRQRSGEVDENGKPIYHTVKKVKVKNQDKLSALKELARINGMYEKDNTQGLDALAKTIADIQSRGSKAPITSKAAERNRK